MLQKFWPREKTRSVFFYFGRGTETKQPDNCQDVSRVWMYGSSDSGFVQIQLWVVHSDCRSTPPLTQIWKHCGVFEILLDTKQIHFILIKYIQENLVHNAQKVIKNTYSTRAVLTSCIQSWDNWIYSIFPVINNLYIMFYSTTLMAAAVIVTQMNLSVHLFHHQHRPQSTAVNSYTVLHICYLQCDALVIITFALSGKTN